MSYTLLQLRTELVNRSGRFDLVSDYAGGDYTDNGANQFINAGQRFLDNQFDTFGSQRVHKQDLASGEYRFNLPLLRNLQRAWLFKHSDTTRTPLVVKTLSELKQKYPSSAFRDVTTGQPLYICPQLLHLTDPQNLYASLSALDTAVGLGTPDFSKDYDELIADNSSNQNLRGVLVMPPADGDYTVSIEGEFYSYFVSDSSYTFWSMNYPELSLMAAMLVLEAFYRNTQGMRDWQEAIRLQTSGIDKNLIKEEITYSGLQLRG